MEYNTLINEKFLELLKCHKCDLYVDAPVELKCCTLLYCENCIKQENQYKCSLCHKLPYYTKNYFLRRITKQITNVKCLFGCGTTSDYKEMLFHMKYCDKRIIGCNIHFCPFIGNKREVLNHLIDNHEKEVLDFNDNFKNNNNLLNNDLL